MNTRIIGVIHHNATRDPPVGKANAGIAVRFDRFLAREDVLYRFRGRLSRDYILVKSINESAGRILKKAGEVLRIGSSSRSDFDMQAHHL
jgi:hypothetical protein